jgi:hypothetical protein
MRLSLLLLTFSLAFGDVFCIRLERDPYRDPYLSFAVLRTVERAVIESGHSINCEGGHRDLRVKVVSFREVPIAYTPEQRVSAYNLLLTISLRVWGKEFRLGGAVPYSLPTGGLGDVPRRKAIDDLLDKLYLNILERLRGGERDADKP